VLRFFSRHRGHPLALLGETLETLRHSERTSFECRCGFGRGDAGFEGDQYLALHIGIVGEGGGRGGKAQRGQEVI
jgi:hypothetical protein